MHVDQPVGNPIPLLTSCASPTQHRTHLTLLYSTDVSTPSLTLPTHLCRAPASPYS